MKSRAPCFFSLQLCVLRLFLETNAELTEEATEEPTVAALPLSLRKASGFPQNV